MHGRLELAARQGFDTAEVDRRATGRDGVPDPITYEGDAFYFRASVSHRFENPSPERCSYLAILDYAPLG